MCRLAFAVLAAATIATAGWRRGALSVDGAWAATIVGATTLSFGGRPAASTLVAFFVSGSLLSRRQAVPGEVAPAKGRRRDAVQVLANGGVAALGAAAAALGVKRGRGALLGALAAAAADTWASEIGVRSASPPRSVLTGRVVEPGSSGGTSGLGWLAAAGGSLLVGATYALGLEERGRIAWVRILSVALVGGLLGSLADSLVGAAFQASYRCTTCGVSTEARQHDCGMELVLVRGWPRVTNDVVNVVCTSVGGLIGALALGPKPEA